MYVERWCEVRRVPNNPTVLCPCYIICRVNTNQRSGCPDTQTWYNCNIDNSWIVSYNIYLLLKYACHINVVMCTSVNIIRYVYKNNFKGGDLDMASYGVPGQYGQPAPPQNEIAEFEDLQSCGTTEACWRLYGFETSMLYPQYKDWM
jgi:hypothetical protein